MRSMPVSAMSLPPMAGGLAIDLLAGAMHQTAQTMLAAPRILVFDSGFGGLTVFADIVSSRPDAHYVYVADDAAFPYGSWPEDALIARLVNLMAELIALHAPDCIVLACNTASTLVLPALRARFSTPFVGTVPAIKSAAERSRSRVFSVLATPGTVTRDYTRNLIASFASDCQVTLVGSLNLAAMAEAEISGKPASDADILAEILPCFVTHQSEEGLLRTDVVTLSCTHYPLLLDRLVRLAPWPVVWINPAPAIARRVVQLLGVSEACCEQGTSRVCLTSGNLSPSLLSPSLREVLARHGLGDVIAPPDRV